MKNEYDFLNQWNAKVLESIMWLSAVRIVNKQLLFSWYLQKQSLSQVSLALGNWNRWKMIVQSYPISLSDGRDVWTIQRRKSGGVLLRSSRILSTWLLSFRISVSVVSSLNINHPIRHGTMHPVLLNLTDFSDDQMQLRNAS